LTRGRGFKPRSDKFQLISAIPQSNKTQQGCSKETASYLWRWQKEDERPHWQKEKDTQPSNTIKFGHAKLATVKVEELRRTRVRVYGDVGSG
jgi:hypothetical protein